ncbi:MAG TPA: MerR family transcriptional regulator [Sphingobium sp.]
MEKADGAFLTIGELAQQLGVAQHILRYWESRFAQLRPLQRAGNRRYYRPQDVEIAQRIHRLLNVEGFTIKGAAKALSARGDVNGSAPAAPAFVPAPAPPADATVAAAPPAPTRPAVTSMDALFADVLIERLRTIRGALCDALGEDTALPSGSVG